METPTPESDEVFGPRVTGVRARKCRDLERRLTLCRDLLACINSSQIMDGNIHAKITETLHQTAPK